MPEGGALLLRMSTKICKRSFRDSSVGGILLGVLSMSLSMNFSVFVKTPGFLEFMPFAGTKTECNQDGE
jgi:hypothetical protein